MSIELDNPKTTLEKVDAAANFVEQMMLAHMVGDGTRFMLAKGKASRLLHEATQQLQERKKR